MAPGPTPVPEEVLLAMANPIIHHRTPAFEKIFAEVQGQLKWLYQTKNDVLLFAGSGSGAMEASLANTLCRGDEIVVVNGGKFGERFAKIAKAYGIVADEMKVTWGEAVSAQDLEKKLKEKNYRAVCVQASETSTGVAHPIREISELVKKYPNTILIVDAITALGVIDLPTDQWGIDLVICGSQKALMLPPGLATVSVSEKAWSFVAKSDLPKFYFSFKAERKALHDNTTAWTPAVSLVIGLNHALKRMQTEGLENMFARHEKMASSVRAAAQAIGLQLYAKSPSNAVTAIYSPDAINSGKIVSGLRDRFNITIANGQDEAKGRIFRIGHLGYYDILDMVAVWSAVEKQLLDLGYKFEVGAGVKAMIERM